METTELKQTNEKSVTIHPYTQGEECYPFAILEITEVINENGDTTSTFEPILGEYRLCEEPFETKQQVEDYIKSKPYDLILALICNTLEMKKKFEKEQQELLKHKQEHETK